MSEPAALRRLEEWLCAAIVQPDPPELSPGSPGAAVRSSSRLTAAQRLDLYRRSHRLRLLETLRASYPGLRHMLGEELFDEFALDYLRARPSRDRTLQRLAAGFADHLAATRPDATRRRETWSDLIIDLVHLEQTFADVYDAPGVEGENLPSSADLPVEPDPSWRAAIVEPVRCLRLLRASFAAGPYLATIRRGEEPPPPVPAESFLAVSRRDFVVTMTPLSSQQHRLLDRLANGVRVDAASAEAGMDFPQAWRSLRDWTDCAFFGSLRPPPHSPAPAADSERECR